MDYNQMNGQVNSQVNNQMNGQINSQGVYVEQNGAVSTAKPKRSIAKAVVSLILGVHCLLYGMFSICWPIYVWLIRTTSYTYRASGLIRFYYSLFGRGNVRAVMVTYFTVGILYILTGIVLGIVALCLGGSYSRKNGKHKLATTGSILSIVGLSLSALNFILLLAAYLIPMWWIFRYMRWFRF